MTNELPEIKCAIIGTGDLESEVKEVADRLHLRVNLDFLGYLNNPMKVLHSSSVLLMTSVSEGTPMSALEAMTLGVPIVSTPTDGLCEVVIDGSTGFLSNDNHLLASRIIGILNDKVLYEELSQNSINRAKTIMDLNNYHEILKASYKS